MCSYWTGVKTPNMCHLLDGTKLHLIKIIMSACMISVSLHLTRHADGFVTVFFLNTIS